MINVNLLPPDIKEEISQARKNRQVQLNYWKSLGLLFLMVIIVAGSAYLFIQKKETLSNRLTAAQASIDEYSNIEVRAAKDSAKLTKLKGILGSSNKWSGVLEEINRLMPASIILNNLDLDSAKSTRQTISGDAPNRDAVIKFRDDLEASKMFNYVDIDMTTTATDQSGSTKENFTISFSLEDGVLK